MSDSLEPGRARSSLPAALVGGLAGLAFLCGSLRAQEPELRPNLAYVEIMGAGIGYSVNYEHLFPSGLSVRAGMGWYPFEGLKGSIWFGTAAWRIGEQHHALRLGAGAGVIFAVEAPGLEGEEDTAGYAVLIAGYEYRFPPGKWFLRAQVTPIFATGGFLFWGGVSFGYAF